MGTQAVAVHAMLVFYQIRRYIIQDRHLTLQTSYTALCLLLIEDLLTKIAEQEITPVGFLICSINHTPGVINLGLLLEVQSGIHTILQLMLQLMKAILEEQRTNTMKDLAGLEGF